MNTGVFDPLTKEFTACDSSERSIILLFHITVLKHIHFRSSVLGFGRGRFPLESHSRFSA